MRSRHRYSINLFLHYFHWITLNFIFKPSFILNPNSDNVKMLKHARILLRGKWNNSSSITSVDCVGLKIISLRWASPVAEVRNQNTGSNHLPRFVTLFKSMLTCSFSISSIISFYYWFDEFFGSKRPFSTLYCFQNVVTLFSWNNKIQHLYLELCSCWISFCLGACFTSFTLPWDQVTEAFSPPSCIFRSGHLVHYNDTS